MLTHIPKMVSAHEAFCAYLEKHRKWGLYVSFSEKHDGDVSGDIAWQEMQKAASFLVLPTSKEIAPPNSLQHIQCLMDRCGYFVFNLREEMQTAFFSCVGDDGVTEENPLGSDYFSCYAMTFGPYRGEYKILNENT